MKQRLFKVVKCCEVGEIKLLKHGVTEIITLSVGRQTTRERFGALHNYLSLVLLLGTVLFSARCCNLSCPWETQLLKGRAILLDYLSFCWGQRYSLVLLLRAAMVSIAQEEAGRNEPSQSDLSKPLL